jgi:hypothetical protein
MIKNWIKQSFTNGLIFAFAILLVWVLSGLSYAVWTGLKAENWDNLTIDKWNALVTQVDNLNLEHGFVYKNDNITLDIQKWEEALPWLSCKDIYESRTGLSDGKYWIKPEWVSTSFEAYCDMTTDWWGWTLVLVTGNWSSHSWSSAEVEPSNLIPTPLPAANQHYKYSDTLMNSIKWTTWEDIAIRMIESEVYGTKKFWKRSCNLWTSHADTNDIDCTFAVDSYSDSPTYINLAYYDDRDYYLSGIEAGVNTSYKRLSIRWRNNKWFHYWRAATQLWQESFWWTMWVR